MAAAGHGRAALLVVEAGGTGGPARPPACAEDLVAKGRVAGGSLAGAVAARRARGAAREVHSGSTPRVARRTPANRCRRALARNALGAAPLPAWGRARLA